MKIGLVTEGPRDADMIEAIISHVLAGSHSFRIIQPELSATGGWGEYGAGWKGIRGWCQSLHQEDNFGSLAKLIAGVKYDLLIVQIDVDVSREADIGCAKPCPPAADTAKAMEDMLLQWLDEAEFPNKVVLCIPSDNLEAWILLAFDPETDYHHPPEKYLECLQKPDHIISDPSYKLPRRLLKRRTNGSIKKPQKVYQDELIPKVLECWEQITLVCPQAERFEQDLKTLSCLTPPAVSSSTTSAPDIHTGNQSHSV